MSSWVTRITCSQPWAAATWAMRCSGLVSHPRWSGTSRARTALARMSLSLSSGMATTIGIRAALKFWTMCSSTVIFPTRARTLPGTRDDCMRAQRTAPIGCFFSNNGHPFQILQKFPLGPVVGRKRRTGLTDLCLETVGLEFAPQFPDRLAHPDVSQVLFWPTTHDEFSGPVHA